MKKNLLLGITFTVFSIIISGCNDDDTPVPEGYTRVNFTAEIPSVIGERAYGDGLTANKLSYAAYDATSGTLRIDKIKEVDIEGGRANFSVDLPKGFKYDFVFWADAQESPYTFDAEKHAITVDYTNAVSNDDSRDAFYGTVKGVVINSSTNLDVSLTRPFAQINLGATDYYKNEVTKAGFTVKNAANSIDLITGDVSGAVSATFAPSALPTSEEFPVKGDITYLAMNYIPVSTDKALVEVEFTATKDTQAEAVNRTFYNVPIQLNFRTNIYGNILTDPEASTTTITVSLK